MSTKSVALSRLKIRRNRAQPLLDKVRLRTELVLAVSESRRSTIFLEARSGSESALERKTGSVSALKSKIRKLRKRLKIETFMAVEVQNGGLKALNGALEGLKTSGRRFSSL
jgi:hypothetical protein